MVTLSSVIGSSEGMHPMGDGGSVGEEPFPLLEVVAEDNRSSQW